MELLHAASNSRRKDDNSMTHEDHDSPILAVLKHYGSPETREEFLRLFYMGDVPEEICAEDECEFSKKFQLATLIEMRPASDRIQ
jgi:hypothetical protein